MKLTEARIFNWISVILIDLITLIALVTDDSLRRAIAFSSPALTGFGLLVTIAF